MQIGNSNWVLGRLICISVLSKDAVETSVRAVKISGAFQYKSFFIQVA